LNGREIELIQFNFTMIHLADQSAIVRVQSAKFGNTKIPHDNRQGSPPGSWTQIFINIKAFFHVLTAGGPQLIENERKQGGERVTAREGRKKRKGGGRKGRGERNRRILKTISVEFACNLDCCYVSDSAIFLFCDGGRSSANRERKKERKRFLWMSLFCSVFYSFFVTVFQTLDH